jgi:uncharacterized protein (TIGR00369 family)
MTDEHYRKLERMYARANSQQYYSTDLTISEGAAELHIPIREDFHHAAGAVHGSVYMKAIDDTAFFAANSLVTDVFVLTQQLNVYFLRPIVSGTMIARSTVVMASRSLWVTESVVTDDAGREIGRGTGTFVRSKQALGPEIGYE